MAPFNGQLFIDNAGTPADLERQFLAHVGGLPLRRNSSDPEVRARYEARLIHWHDLLYQRCVELAGGNLMNPTQTNLASQQFPQHPNQPRRSTMSAAQYQQARQAALAARRQAMHDATRVRFYEHVAKLMWDCLMPELFTTGQIFWPNPEIYAAVTAIIALVNECPCSNPSPQHHQTDFYSELNAASDASAFAQWLAAHYA